MSRSIFTGFDSAWGGRVSGAICDLLLSPNESSPALELGAPPDLVRWPEAVARLSGGTYSDASLHVLAIDQGLVVPNETGMRPVERNVARALMSKFKCGAYPSNRSNTSCYGPDAGIWKLINALHEKGYVQSPEQVATPGCSDGKFFFECYPHPAIIGLFDLDLTLQYKVHKRNPDDWKQLIQLLRGLSECDVPITNICSYLKPTFEQDKANEDCVDAIVAAYTAAWLWRFGWERSMCVGNAHSGYMVTPVSPTTRAAFESSFADSDIEMVDIGQVAASSVSANLHPSRSRDTQVKDGSTVTLRITDPGNLQETANSWMIQTKCEGHLLKVRIVDLPEEPQLTFGPFKRLGVKLRGMKPWDDETKLVWKDLAAGCSNANPSEYEAVFCYEKIDG